MQVLVKFEWITKDKLPSKKINSYSYLKKIVLVFLYKASFNSNWKITFRNKKKQKKNKIKGKNIYILIVLA